MAGGRRALLLAPSLHSGKAQLAFQPVAGGVGGGEFAIIKLSSEDQLAKLPFFATRVITGLSPFLHLEHLFYSSGDSDFQLEYKQLLWTESGPWCSGCKPSQLGVPL